MSDAVREVSVPNPEGLHLRPAMRFVETASRFQSEITVTNLTRRKEPVDGKSPMEMALLEAARDCVLRIAAKGADAEEAVETLAALVRDGFPPDPETSEHR